MNECPESYGRTPGVGVSVCVHKNFNVACNSWTTTGTQVELSYLYSLWQDLSMGTKFFYLVTLTLKFDLHVRLKNFNLGHSSLTRRGRAFIFHMYIPCDTTFLRVQKFLT